MKRTLFIIDWITIGDLIIMSPMFMTFKIQFNSEIYLTSKVDLCYNYMKDVFNESQDLTVVDEYNENAYDFIFQLDIEHDEVCRECLRSSIHRNDNYHFIFYDMFNKKYNYDLEYKIYGFPFSWKAENIFDRSKPICLINPNSTANLKVSENSDARAWPFEYYQKVVDELGNDINFIQIGNSIFNTSISIPKLSGNIIDFTNKTDTKTLLMLIHSSDFVLTHECGISNICQFGSTYKNRHNFIILGHRMLDNQEQPIFKYNNEDKKIFNHYLTIYCDRNETCHAIFPFVREDDNENSICKHIDNHYANCMTCITPEIVINEFKRIMKEQEDGK